MRADLLICRGAACSGNAQWIDAGAARAAFATQNFATFRALLRLARTLLRSYYPLLGPWAGMLVQSLLAGAQPRGVVR